MSYGLSSFGSVSFGTALIVITEVTFFRAASDVTTNGWTGTTSPLANAINEEVLNRASNITSPDLTSPITFALTAVMPAGTYNSRIDVKQTAGNAEVRLVCLNDAGVTQGTSAWQATTATDTTYTLPITTTGASTRFRIEVR